MNRPVYALAPMAGVADSAFRQTCKDFGADVVYSEMASATALVYAPKKTLELLEFSKKERPYVVQIFGSNPEYFARATQIITKKVKPDGIDINFGCPVKKVQKQGAGAVLMDNPKLAHKIIKSVIDNTNLPVSIKIRSKAKKCDALKFLKAMRDLDVKAVMIHARTLKQGFSGEVDYEIIKKARKYFKGVLLANGGAMNAEEASSLLKKTGADGVGIARGAMGRPWIFEEVKRIKSKAKIKEEIFKIALRHAKLVEKLKGEQGIVEMRKHLCWYVSGLSNAGKLRQELIQVKSFDGIKKILK